MNLLRITKQAHVAAISFLLCICGAVDAAEYYVDAARGSDFNSGTSAATPWKTLTTVNGKSFQPGDSIYLKRGAVWRQPLEVRSAGKAFHPITFGAYGNGDNPVIESLTVSGDYVIFENLVVEHQKYAGDAVRIRGAKKCVLRNMTVRNGIGDGIDAHDADGLLIESCLIHHFLAGSFTNQFDAHGIVATATQGITIRNTEVHHVSGDSFQTDPNRSFPVSDDILIEDCHFWTGPLKESFNANWLAGQTPGENAIDTKVAKKTWRIASRMRITIRNMLAHGWVKGYVGNRAAFNMKEKVEVVFDRVTVYDCEIAFRLRGTRGNANVTLMNTVIYNCEKAIRAEDNLANLKVYNSTFGDAVGTTIKFAPRKAQAGVGSWDFRNNAFVGSAPDEANHSSNKSAVPADFVNSGTGDYRLKASSALIDVGETLPWVIIDRDKTYRSGPYDVGAYEHVRK